MRADCRTDNVVCICRMTTPVAYGFVGGIFQRHVSRCYRNDCRSEHFHLFHIDVLAFHICFPHIDDAFHIHQCTDGSCCHAMLSGSRLGNDTCFSHAARQKYLPDGVVYFMGSRMIEVLSFQVYFTSIFFREAACQIEWGRTAHIITQ